jgi:hypothetical protein
MAQTLLVRIKGRRGAIRRVPRGLNFMVPSDYSYGYTFPKCRELFERLSTKAGAENPFAFTRLTPAKHGWDDLDVLMGEVKEDEPQPRWFKIALGLNCFDKWVGYLETHPNAIGKRARAQWPFTTTLHVLAELKVIRAILAGVSGRKREFRLDIRE